MPMAPRAAGQALQGLVGQLPAVVSGAGAPGQRVRLSLSALQAMQTQRVYSTPIRCCLQVGEDTSVLLNRIFERPLRFGEVDLARSLSHPGTGGRLRIVMDKLLRGARWLESSEMLAHRAQGMTQSKTSAARMRCSDARRAGQPITALILGGSIEIGGNLHQQDDAYFVRPSSLPANTLARACLLPVC